MSSSLVNVIIYYQRSIEKNGHDEKRLLHCIEKLYKLPIKLEHLQSTGVGKTVNSLRKYDKEVGVAAKALVAKWKAMVAAEAQVAEDEENEDIQPGSQDDDSDNTPENNNTRTDSQNDMVHEDEERSLHSKHNGRSSSSGNKDRNQNVHDSSSKTKSHEHRSHSSSSKRKHGESRSDKQSSSSGREGDHKKWNKRQHLRNKEKESDSDSEERETAFKLSIVQAIEQDFEVLDDDDDEEKLIIDVSKEKTEDIDKKKSKSESQSSSKNRHHNSRDSSKKDSHRTKEGSRSREKSSKESSHSKESSRKESKYSKEDPKKESSGSNESSRKGSDHNNRESSRKEDNRSKDDNSHSKESSHQESSYSKDKDKERSSERRDKKEECYKSEEIHKSKQSESRDKESSKKDREKQSTSNQRSNGEHHKNKHKDKEREKDKEKEKHSKDLKRKNSDSDAKSSEGSPPKAKVPKILVDGIDSSMGTSFEEALGMISVSSSSKGSIKPSKTSPKVNASSSSSSGIFVKPSSRSPKRSKTPPLLTATIKLEPLDPSIALELPTISPNYKPLPLNPTVMECVFSSNKPQQRRLFTDEEAMSAGISSKTMRTKVYSGIKTGAQLQVGSLFDLCIRVLQKNIDALEFTGGVPFEVLKPVLERATPHQLITFEEFNPYLMEDSDVLWQQHCARYYRGQKREEMETWREMFLRCKEEQDRKLSMLAENIKQSQKQIQQPVRKTQLAYVDSMVKPPRNVIRKQEQYGTKSSVSATPAARVAALSNITSNASKVGDFRLKAAAASPDTVQIAVAANSANNGRPKKAPLMQKTIKLMKGRFRR